MDIDLAAIMDANGIKRAARYKIGGYCWVQLTDGREGTGATFGEAVERAQAERLAA